jgi:hypothetical protein
LVTRSLSRTPLQAYAQRFGPLLNSRAFNIEAKAAIDRLGVTGARNFLRRDAEITRSFSNADFSRFAQEYNKSKTAGASLRRVRRDFKPSQQSLIVTARDQSRAYQYRGSFTWDSLKTGEKSIRSVIFNSDTALSRGDIEDRLNAILGGVQDSIDSFYGEEVEISDLQLDSAWYNPNIRPDVTSRIIDEV